MTVLDAYCAYLEGLTPDDLGRLEAYVAPNVRFIDPFNDVTGVDAMRRVFQHMFDNIGDVRFTVQRKLIDEDAAMLAWRFDATLRDRPWSFDGTSVLVFDADGQVVSHVDHWDAARNFYERLPVIGWLLARLRGSWAIR